VNPRFAKTAIAVLIVAFSTAALPARADLTGPGSPPPPPPPTRG